MAKAEAKVMRLGLVSMPWSIFNRPSIQLASLGAYLEGDAGISTSLFHPYLAAAAAIGSENYFHLAKNSWAGEALYSPLLFPEQAEQAKSLFDESCRGEVALKGLDFSKCSGQLEQALEEWLDSIDFSSFDLIGFSICFNQLLSSLTAAARIKKHYPQLPIVIGGSGCVGTIGSSLLRAFPQLDYVISGEGELALQQLCHSLAAGKRKKTGTLPPQVISRETGREIPPPCTSIKDLNTLPPPDYSPYFTEMQNTFPGQNFIPVLPLEFSRGCWWNKCTFCNLNLQWHGYRWKRAETMLRELHHLSSRYQCLDFCFTDNALPPREADTFFKELEEEKKDYDFFAEVRVMSDPERPRLYRRAGLSSIQVGIEALSASLLRKMKKGTTVMENIAAMRHSLEADITLDGNLITEFPGSSQDEVNETLNALDYVLPYTPLSAASFFLGHGSPVAENPKEYDILAVTQHVKNRKLFPRETIRELDMLIKDYRGDRGRQRKMWRPVSEKIKEWQRFHKKRSPLLPPLSYRDGGTFLLIRQEQLLGPVLQHRLQGVSREIYLFCCRIRTLEEIRQQFPGIKEQVLRKFLQDLDRKKILFHEKDRYLALGVKQILF
ncbi:MAG: RiPP maturation radical SAM C-methyltransferase [Thermodesulfobacteriota bacterium]